MSTPETPAGPAPTSVADAQALLDQHAATVAAAQKTVDRQKTIDKINASQAALAVLNGFSDAVDPAVTDIRTAAADLAAALAPSLSLSVIGQIVGGLDGLATMAGHLRAALETDLKVAQAALADLDA